MKSYEEALALIIDHAKPLDAEDVPIQGALNRILAIPVTTAYPLPPFTNSQMDGYAVRSVDLADANPTNPIELSVTQFLLAGGSAQIHLLPGQAARIMTGAPLPDGADCIVPQEDVEAENGRATFRAPSPAGEFVRYAGEDRPAGAVILERGERIRAGGLGAAASAGLLELNVAAHPRVGLIATGNELVEPGTILRPGQIYNSNPYTLQAQIEEAGGSVVHRLKATDDHPSLRSAFDACRDCDLIVTSGGVSVGERDFLRPVIEELGEILFWQVAIRPGKPVALGKIGRVPVLALPGNPASSFVTFELFGRPLLLKMQGAKITARRTIPVTLAEDVAHGRGRRSFLRVVLTLKETEVLATPTGSQNSGMVTSAAFAEGLLVVSEHIDLIKSGQRALAILLD